ncbi:MAG: CDP-alcohol phosphatidyltransferase [Sphingomonadales bacterium]|jgi:phosphatidylglycerophosphate synthase|nr:CDP-alcohol phosphatidyltransferase [Sphingomonadales bacterium]MEA3034565.1 CDP-alcohol phosphatidyltransferase [Sphingomonadales bacterium]
MAGRNRRRWFWATQALSAARVVLTYLFVVLSPFARWWHLAAALYVIALSTDLIDGRLARAKRVASRIGGAMDAYGDRYLAIASLLYAAARGVNLAVIGIIILRDLFALSMRLIMVDGRRMMYFSPKVTGLVLVVIGCGTLNLVCHPGVAATLYYQAPFDLVAAFYVFYFPWTVRMSWRRMHRAVTFELEESPPNG